MTTERLENESDASYEMFQTYLFMGFGRSVTELAREHQVSRQNIYEQMKKYNWKERIEIHDKKILAQIRERHNSSFQADAFLRRENVKRAYSLMQATFSKMLDYSDKYTSNTMEADEFLHKTDKLFSIIQKYERISQSCENYMQKFGIKTVCEADKINANLEEANQEISDFSSENSELIEEEIENQEIEKSLNIEDFTHQINDDIELTQEELDEIERDVKFGFPGNSNKKDRQKFRQQLIFDKIKEKFKEINGFLLEAA